jgi:PBSX family phage terminase large subunit
LKSFKVFDHQNKFIRSQAKYPALVAGYGSGKTVAFVLKAILEAGRNPTKTILLAEPTFPMIRDVLQPTLEETLEQLGFQYKYRASEMKYTIIWKNGYSNIILRSAENYRRWAGLNLAGVGLDEAALLKDDKAWKMGLSRLRDGNHLSAWITTTPEGFNFVYDLWKDKPKSGYDLIQGKTTDNTFLPQDFIDSLYENYDDKLISSYINGNFVNLQYGTCYYAFDRDKNVKQVSYNSSLPIRIAMDFNVDPISCVLFQIYADKPKIRVFDEIQLSHSGGNDLMTERLAKLIKEKYPYENPNLLQPKRQKVDTTGHYICYPDPAGKNRHTSALMSDHDILRRQGFGLRVKKKAPSVIDSVNAVNKAMDFTIVDPKCKEFIKDLEQVVLKEGTREIDKSNNALTHLTDAFRYSVDYEFPVKKPVTRTYMA